MLFLTAWPIWLSGLLLVGGGTVLAMLGPVVVRRRFGLEKLITNNEVAGFKFATIGVLYAVLLAFVVIVVWEKFNDAEVRVAEEAGAAASIYRLAEGLGGPTGSAIQTNLSTYLSAAVERDWPAMEHGHGSPDVTDALSRLYTTAVQIVPHDARDQALLEETLHQLDQMTDARRGRLVMASGKVPGIIWLVLFGGAAVTIAFTFFFGTENLAAQALMTGALAILIFALLEVIVVVDHPFSGSIKVLPEALLAVRDNFYSLRP